MRIARFLTMLVGVAGLIAVPSVVAQEKQFPHQAQIEARILSLPRSFRGSDGLRHVAYELRITSFQNSDDPLTLTRMAIFADRSAVPLRTIDGAALGDLTVPATSVDSSQSGISVPSGGSVTLFLWMTLPVGVRPSTLRHQLSFRTAKGAIQRADDIRTAVIEADPIRISSPLRGGRWLAVEGPGNHLSHHWGSLVAIDGRLTIPQRFAIDWFRLDERNHSLRGAFDNLASTSDADWLGYGQDVLAVADGVVVDARGDVPNGKPLAPQGSPDDLTARTLYGNFVILKIGPNVYAHYAHLRAGSLIVRIGQRVRRGEVIGRLGQTGAAGAPHLHFHLSDRRTFEGSEGLPFVIDAFTRLGGTSIEETFDTRKKVDLLSQRPRRAISELPLDGDVVVFR